MSIIILSGGMTMKDSSY